MLDLFGLRSRKTETPQGRVAEPAAAESAGSADPPSEKPGAGGASPRKKFWAVLLILDTLFVFIFGGALAGMLVTHWSNPSAPAPPQLPARRKAAPKKTGPPAEPEPAAPAPAAPDARLKAHRENPPGKPAGSPSVVAPDLPRREASPAAPKQKAATAPSSETQQKPRARPAQFACRVPAGAGEVLLKGPFLVRTGGVKKMFREADGAWRTTVSLLPGSYKYHCVADGKKLKAQSIDVP